MAVRAYAEWTSVRVCPLVPATPGRQSLGIVGILYYRWKVSLCARASTLIQPLIILAAKQGFIFP